MELTQKLIGDILVFEPEGELMGGNDLDEFRGVIDEALSKEQVKVVVDMEKVSWMNSSGLGMLISALTTLRSAGGDMKLANLSERLRRPIQITKLDSVFEEFDSVEKAVASYQ